MNKTLNKLRIGKTVGKYDALDVVGKIPWRQAVEASVDEQS